MLTLGDVQLEAFEEDAWKRFERTMVLHARRYFPVDSAMLGEPQLRRAMRHGIARARGHGLATEGDVCQYINLMMALGGHYDRDPQLPWAAGSLGKKVDPGMRMERLREGALEYLEAAAGKDGGHYLRAMMRARSLSYEAIAGAASLDKLLAELWPAKHKVVLHERAMGPFEALHQQLAEAAGLRSRAPRALYGALMFLLGSRFAEDPLVPWAGPILSDVALDEEQKARALFDAAKVNLDRAISLLRAKGE